MVVNKVEGVGSEEKVSSAAAVKRSLRMEFKDEMREQTKTKEMITRNMEDRMTLLIM